MSAEVSAFLLKEKHKNLLNGLGSTFPCRKSKGRAAIEKLQALTEMTVVDAYVGRRKMDPPDEPSQLHHSVSSLLCEGIARNTQDGGDVEVSGSPTEKAILSWALKLGMEFDVIRSESVDIHVFPFNSEKKRGGVAVRRANSDVYIHSKGAAEMILASCTKYLDSDGHLQSVGEEEKGFFKNAIDDMASRSLQCVAIAYTRCSQDSVPSDDEGLQKWELPDDDLDLLAIVGIKMCNDGVPVRPIHLLEDAIDAYHIKRMRTRWKNQRKLKQAISKFLEEGRNVTDQSDPPPSYSLTEPSRSNGRETTVDELVSNLMNTNGKELRVLPVVGSIRQDKTEVVRSAYNNIRVKHHFEFRAWVYLDSQCSDCRHILVNLINQGIMSRTTDLDHMEEEALQDMLFQMLMGKRYLIVFINIRTEKEWTELVVPLPNTQNGSRIMITTTSTEVTSFIDPFSNPMWRTNMDKEPSWKLLLKHVGNPSIQDPEITEQYGHLKKILMQKCKGISRAISLLGGMLYNKQICEWKEIMTGVPDIHDDTRVVSTMLDLIYRDLPPAWKVCLIYLILFPEELEIPVRRLLLLWMAEGFFNTEIPEDDAEECLDVLINKKLIEVTNRKLDGRPKSCRMPGYIRHLLQNISDQADHSVSKSASQSPGETEPRTLSPRRFAEHGRNNNQVLIEQTHKHLHSYLCFNTHIRGTPNTDIGSFLKVLIRRKTGLAFLRVLDLEGVYKPQLPNTIGTLLLLKFLGLRLTVLDSIPESICKLPLLETLDLKHTNVSVLPSSIWKSKSLRHLYVNEVRLNIRSIPKTSIGCLNNNFQTIRGLYIVDEGVVSSVLERFVNLRKVTITCRDKCIQQVTEWISRLNHLESLKLRSLDGLGKPSPLSIGEDLKTKNILMKLYLLGKIEGPNGLHKILPRCLTKLTLSSSEIDEEFAMDVLGDLPKLVILRFLSNSYKSSQMSFKTGKFLKLRGLKLWMLPELEVCEVETGAMPCLEELEIRKCINVKTLHGLEHLSHLNELVLTNMPSDLAQYIKSHVKNNIFIQENAWKFSYY